MENHLLQWSGARQNASLPEEAFGQLEETGAVDDSGAHRPARLYRFINRDVVLYN
jgi:hypothetical protein